MTTGYGDTYRGLVIDNYDPEQRNRLKVRVPEIFGDEDSGWAEASLSSPSQSIPSVGDEVWVSFEAGNTDYPVWQTGEDTTPSGDGPQSYNGKYRGLVIDNADPMGEHRLNVRVPELGDEQAWAAAGIDVGDDDLPAIDTHVWIEYEYGDPQYPRWVGLA